MKKLLHNLLLPLCLGLVITALPTLARDNPNVIIIFSDDHGYTDLGAHGIDSNLDTPNMDKLARGGAMMTSGYSSAPQCRPSRCGLMAGRIQNEFGFSENHANSGEGEGTLPRTYPTGTDMAGQPLLTIADRMKALGYVTGFSGKWHCGTNDDQDAKYDPRGRGFDEYWVGPNGTFSANIDLKGNRIPHQKVVDHRNRVIVQGEACESFIERNKDKPFFLYFPIFGPHVPLIDLDDPYYLNFPRQNYPHWNDAQDDVRRQGLALLKAMDDAIGGVVKKLRSLGLEDNTLILFAGDNGAPTKMRTGGGTPDVNGWNGSSNVPMRGNKGNLLEGGIRVPMFAYWKGKILPGQVINEMVTTLDFTATTLVAGGGELPSEFDGVDILPRLTGVESEITRSQPMFWDFYEEQAVRMGDWKLWRNGYGDRLFNIAEDPSELANVINQFPEKAAQLAAQLDDWVSTLRADATSELKKSAAQGESTVKGAPAGVKADPRYKVPYDNPKPSPYPLPMTGSPIPHGKEAPDISVLVDESKEKSRSRSTEGIRAKRSRKSGQTIDGWTASGACSLSGADGQLFVECDEGAAFFSVGQFQPLVEGPFTLNIRLKSKGFGKLLVIYNRPSPSNVVRFPLEQDGDFHEYQVTIPVGTLDALRFNSAKTAGTAVIEWIRILNNSDAVVRSWEF